MEALFNHLPSPSLSASQKKRNKKRRREKDKIENQTTNALPPPPPPPPRVQPTVESTNSKKAKKASIKASQWNFAVDYNDHFETPLVAYQDLRPYLEGLAKVS